MSSPIGHSLIGYIIGAISNRTIAIKNYGTVLFYIIVSNAPDLDFLPGILVGKPNLYHHGISHSIGFGIIFCAGVVFLYIYIKKQSMIRTFLLLLSLYSSHLILDFISLDGRPPIGIPLFWPLSSEYYIFIYPILPPIMHSSLDKATLNQFFVDIFSIHNLHVIFLELTAVMPAFLALVILRWKRKKLR